MVDQLSSLFMVCSSSLPLASQWTDFNTKDDNGQQPFDRFPLKTVCSSYLAPPPFKKVLKSAVNKGHDIKEPTCAFIDMPFNFI